MWLSYINAALWAAGHGLTSTMLVFFLAGELGAQGLILSLILAAPNLVGVLRLGTPALIDRMFNRKRFCIVCYALSGVMLIALPVASAPGVLPTVGTSLTALVVLWCLYHLLEYLATIALWSWLADLVPSRVRGRFIGRRNRWLTLTRTLGMLASGGFAFLWRDHYQHEPEMRWLGYAIPAVAGAALMVGAVIPLARLLDVRRVSLSAAPAPPGKILAPFRDRNFVRLLTYGCWFSLVNGITQLSQSKFLWSFLTLTLLTTLSLPILMKLGQSAVSPRLGRLVDQLGNRPVMIVSQAIVSTGPLFYYFATPEAPFWIAGAWIAWIAYAGLNIGLTNLTLKMAPDGNASPYLSVYFAITGLCYGVSTLAGGRLFGYLAERPELFSHLSGVADHYEALFLLGTIARLSGVLLLQRVVEPGRPKS